MFQVDLQTEDKMLSRLFEKHNNILVVKHVLQVYCNLRLQPTEERI